jgi:outer membrane protein assembly factor BamD (BamD/ComL family)
VVRLAFLCVGVTGQETSAATLLREFAPALLSSNIQDARHVPRRPETQARIAGEFQSAPALFRQGRYAEAERQFAWIAEVRRGTTWGERAQYYLAECQYRQKKYVKAFASFERLNTDYPATEHNDELIRREFEIARLWMAQCDPSTRADKKLPWIARLDGRLPFLFTRKLARDALAQVRRSNPTGELADDALIQIADDYLKGHEFDLAVACYDQFVAEYPRSPYRLYARIARIVAAIQLFVPR